MNTQYRSFIDARKYIRTLKLKSSKWDEYCNSGKKPNDIPATVRQVYKKEWISWGDFLGTGNIHPSKRKYMTYESAKKLVHELKLKNQREWNLYCKSDSYSYDVPVNPHITFKNEWTTWGDWLGTGYVHPSTRKYQTYESAKKFVHGLNLTNRTEWEKFCDSNEKPDDIPNYPNAVYRKKGWKDWGDWLGTGYVHPINRNYLSIKEAKIQARKLAKELGIKTHNQWLQAHRDGKIPADIPRYLGNFYNSPKSRMRKQK